MLTVFSYKVLNGWVFNGFNSYIVFSDHSFPNRESKPKRFRCVNPGEEPVLF